MRLGVGEPSTIRRPCSIPDGSVIAFVNEDRLFVIDADVPELIGFVPVQKLLAVRRPCWAVAINAAIGSDARRFAAHLRARVQLILAGLIRKKRNGLSVWRPRRIEFMNAGSIRAQVADAAMLGGHGENVAARFDYGSGGGRRQSEAANILRHALELGPGFQIFGVQLDRQVASFSALQI